MKKFSLLIIPFLLAPFCGCTQNLENMSRMFYSMNTGATLVVSAPPTKNNKDNFESLCSDVERELSLINDALSLNLETSSISSFNNAQAGGEVEITKTAYDVLNIAKNIYTLTDGYYNPSVYYSVQAYAFNDLAEKVPEPKDRIPNDEEIQAYTTLSSHFNETKLYEKDNKYYAKKSEQTIDYNGVTYSMKIDLGGIGKGYAVDRVNELMDKYNFKSGFFNFGTSSIVCKKYQKDGDYSLEFLNPREASSHYAQVKVRDTFLSTSGDYQNFFTLDGVRYSHVFDPFTGKPITTGIMSATIIGGTAVEGDALTTALMAMGKERAVKFINEKLSNYRVVFTCENTDGYDIVTNIPPSEIFILSGEFMIINRIENGKIILN